MKEIYLIIIGMSIVTYLPRILPLIFLQKLEINPFLQRFLKYIPYTVLGALIFPGILDSTGAILPALLGGLTALILALFEVNLLITVLGSIIVCALAQMI